VRVGDAGGLLALDRALQPGQPRLPHVQPHAAHLRGERAHLLHQRDDPDVLAVARDRFGDRPAVLVGHSIGGLVAAGAAVREPAAVAATVLVDSIVLDPPRTAVPEWRPPRASRVFGSLDEVVAGFRLTPPQPEADPRVLRAIAVGSVRPVEGGWTGKVDPRIFGAVGRSGLSARLPGLPGPVAVVRGERSVLVPPSAGADPAALTGRPVAQFDVPGAHHHVMVDRPVEFGEHLSRALDAVHPPAP
jgi:pimeloyl-ACP methyl ester carboxylesterase